MSDFLDLQGAKDLNTDAIHISAVANSVDPVTGAPIDTHVNRVGGTDYTLQGFWGALGPVVMPWTSITGGTLTQPNQAFLHPTDKNYYSWVGAYPVGGYVVAPGTDPTTVTGYVPRTDVVLRQQINTDFPESYGAAGNGAADDTSAIASSIAGAGASSYLRKGAKYLVTAISNALGKPFTGCGHVVKAVAGGLEAQNTYADRYQRVTGQENLAAWYRLVYDQHTNPTRQMRIVFSGDSTTAGVGVDAPYQISNLVLTGITENGMQGPYNTACVNNGHSGAHTGQWESTYVYDDISASPDLLVLRWGINDPGYLKDGNPAPIDAGQSYHNRRNITDFATSLRNGLATFRAAKNFYTTSILLMMPNSTYDIPNARDALWYEQMRDVLIQAARDYQCAFIDTYAIMQDSRYLANVLMDNPMSTSGRGIHPNNTMNSIIAGHMLDVIMPKGLRYNLASNKIYAIGGAGLVVNVSLPPSAYGASIYMVRALTSNGWPIDGNALTFRTADDTLIQYCFGYSDENRGKMLIRYGRAKTLGGQPENWSQWFNQVVDGGVIEVGAGSGFTQPSTGKMKVAFSGTQAVLGGSLSMISPAPLTQNRVIGSISASISPPAVAFGTLTLFDGATTFEQIPCHIAPNGNIYAAMASTISPTVIQISLSFDNRI